MHLIRLSKCQPNLITQKHTWKKIMMIPITIHDGIYYEEKYQEARREAYHFQFFHFDFCMHNILVRLQKNKYFMPF